MVYFVCDFCNETLKKNSVTKHCFKCRKCDSVTCVDCSQTFYGDDFVNHNSCISEAEKYQKTLYKENKKLSAQDTWMQSVETSIVQLKDAPNAIQPILSKLSGYENIPRNRSKFENFCRNSIKLSSVQIINEIFTWISNCESRNSLDESTADSANEIIDHAIKNSEIVSVENLNDESINMKKVMKDKKHKKDKRDKKEKKDKKDGKRKFEFESNESPLS